MEHLSRIFQKRKKQNMKRLSFITQFKIEFLLPFTGCRKVLRKMPVCVFIIIFKNITHLVLACFVLGFFCEL